jgi:hypothetical protein
MAKYCQFRGLQNTQLDMATGSSLPFSKQNPKNRDGNSVQFQKLQYPFVSNIQIEFWCRISPRFLYWDGML